MAEWNQVKPEELLEPNKALHVFLTSVAGVGEPPGKKKEVMHTHHLANYCSQQTVTDSRQRQRILRIHHEQNLQR
jgi:hypothetical protein